MERKRLSISTANALTNFHLFESECQHRRVVIFLDYDGTLTPIVNDPAKAHLGQEMQHTLEKLHQVFVTGVISGRSLAKIQHFVNIPQLYYAGSHGFDIAGPNGTSIKNQVAADFQEDLSRLHEELVARTGGIPGAEVEDNTYSVSLHYRNVAPEKKNDIMSIANAVEALHPRIKHNQGKMVHEFKPKMDWNKGKALLWLLQALGLDEPDDVFTIYIGDDTTDEDAFEALSGKGAKKGVGILVTEHSMPTNASFTLQDTSEVCQFLQKLIGFGLKKGATQKPLQGSE